MYQVEGEVQLGRRHPPPPRLPPPAFSCQFWFTRDTSRQRLFSRKNGIAVRKKIRVFMSMLHFLGEGNLSTCPFLGGAVPVIGHGCSIIVESRHRSRCFVSTDGPKNSFPKKKKAFSFFVIPQGISKNNVYKSMKATTSAHIFLSKTLCSQAGCSKKASPLPLLPTPKKPKGT